jgi:hypothetical protein
MGKCRLPSTRVAVPTTPGLSPRLVRAAAKSESSSTAVSTPVRAGIEARGLGVASADDDGFEFEVEPESEAAVLEQAASEAASSPAEMTPIVALCRLRIV